MRRRMSGKGNSTKKRIPRWRAAAGLFLLVWLLLAALWYVEDRVEPVLDQLAEYEAMAAVAHAVDTAVEAAGEDDPELYTALYTVERDESGTVRAVRADTAALNSTRAALLAAVQGALRALPEQNIQVPFGTLTGFSLLSGLGPGWSVTLRPEAFAEASIEEKTEAVAINGQRYTAELVLRITINMVLDGRNRVLYYTCRVPLAGILADGETPIYYGS